MKSTPTVVPDPTDIAEAEPDTKVDETKDICPVPEVVKQVLFPVDILEESRTEFVFEDEYVIGLANVVPNISKIPADFVLAVELPPVFVNSLFLILSVP